MKIELNKLEIQMLSQAGINIASGREYTDDEMFDLVDQIHDIEVQYAQDADLDPNARRLANEYALIADKIQQQIPEE